MSKKGILSIYEINTRVWLMGVWHSSKRGREIALKHEGLHREFLNVLPDLKPDDVACSPYSITGYEPDALLGGMRGIMAFKDALYSHGMKLILDFIPNHVALDHPWVDMKPEYFINGTTQELQDNPGSFFSTDNKAIIAHGKDPYFPAWTDVAQLNYFNPETRQAMLQELLKVALLCDGVRCDMAMLILKHIQKQIWGERVFDGNKLKEPELEFWQEVITDVKKSYPDFILIAEVYWGLETELVSIGFDYVYDKSFYDALREMHIEKLKEVLTKQNDLSNKRLRFIENHDEDRAAKVFGDEKSKAAALIMMLAPGAHLFHQGQLEGFKIKLPVRLIRKPEEIVNKQINSFYKNLLSKMKTIMKEDSQWILLESSPAWDGNITYRNFIGLFNSKNFLVIVNYSDSQSQCYLHPDLSKISSKFLLFKDLLGPAEYQRTKEEIASRGFYLDIPPYGYHLFRITGVD